MKPLTFFYLICVLLVFSCSNSGEQPETDITVEPAIPELVRYTGKSGPGQGKEIVLVSGDEEYRSEEGLPQLARILSERHGFNCTVLFAQDPANPGVIDPNYTKNIPGLENLESADLMVLFTRFRALPDEQMQHVENFLMAGKPLVALRTATHAFEFKGESEKWNHYSNSFRDEASPWNDGFGRLVLGERWHTHHGHHKHQSTLGLIAPNAEDHPITNGIEDGDIWGATDVYGVRMPLQVSVTPLIMGQVMDRTADFDEKDLFFGMRPTDSAVAEFNAASKKDYNPNDPMMPIAWTKTYQLPDGKAGTSFTSTIGASSDLMNEGVRRLLVNAVYHLAGLEVPEKANVDLVGDYQPTQFSFQDDEYWDKKNLQVKDYIVE